jgi:hypothetical protein
MDKYKLLKIIKKNKENDLKRENAWNDRFYVKEDNTPNKININKARNHIKIKSRDIKNINLNIFTEEDSNHKMNITSNLNADNKHYHPHKIKPNKTLNNLLKIKLHKKEKKKNVSHNKQDNNKSEIYKKLLNLWDELGVNYIYQSIYNKICDNLSQEKKDIFYKYEFNKLSNIYNIIDLIINDIENRDKIISQLQKNFKEKEEETDYDEETIKQVTSILTDIRKYSIDIANNISLLRKEIGYDILMNKFDMNKIFIFPNDYLIKMNNDLDFLINCPLNKYFNFYKSDPFLIKINNNNNNCNLPELKEKDDISLVNNYENIIYTELVNQEVNLMSQNSNSFDSIFNFAPKNKIVKKNNTRLNNSKPKNIISNTVIKANRGLSRQKLRPKPKNKLLIEADISNISKAQTHTSLFSTNHLNRNNTKAISNNVKYLAKQLWHEHEDEDEENKIIYKNINQKNAINDDDMKIFEKIIEQSIIEKNNIDKELFDNKIKTIKYKTKITKEKSKNEEISNGTNNNNKFEENDDNNSITKTGKPKKNKNEKLKKEISNFIQDILEESEIENSQKISVTKIRNANANENENKNNDMIYNLDEIEIEAEPIKKVYSTFTIELYKDKLSSLKEIYNNYYKKIPEILKKGFKIQDNITKYLEGIYPKILLIKSNNNNSQIKGIATLSYISHNSNSIIVGKIKSSNYNKNLNITSISCLDESEFSNILINVIDFCKEFFYFENIILELFYLNKNGQFILYTDLEKIIKNEAKFKWVNMENDGINRKIKYRYINNNIDKSKNNNEFNNNILNLKTINVIGCIEEKNYNNMDIRQLSLINDFSINYLLLEMIGQNGFKVNDGKNEGNNYINTLIKKVTFKKMNHLCCDFLLSHLGEADDIKNFIKENEDIFDNKEIMKKINQLVYYELYLGLAMININSSFKNIIKRKYKGYIYNILFDDQINEFSIKDSNNNDMQFYLIKTNEQNTSIIIYEFKKNENLEKIIKLISDKDNKNKEMNISEVFRDLFAKVTKKPSKVNKNICIPSFKITLNQIAFRPSVFSDIIVENDEIDKNYKINCLNIIEEMTFGVDEPFIVQQNVVDLDDNFGENIFIENDFILSVVDNDLIFELQIPTISTFLVKKSYWIKSS